MRGQDGVRPVRVIKNTPGVERKDTLIESISVFASFLFFFSFLHPLYNFVDPYY